MKKLLLLSLFALSLSAHLWAGNGDKRPNVLFIAVDDLKPLLGPYGDKLVKSPNIDRLAKRGVTFQRNYCQQAVCGPTRASIMNGLRPDRTGVWDLKTDFRVVDSSIVSLPQYLVSQGYETQGFGKIYHEASAAPGHDAKSWSVAYDPTKAPSHVLTTEKRSTESADVPDTTYVDGKLAQKGVEALGKLAKGTKPFFLAVGFKKPHLPFVAPKKYWDLYDRSQFIVDPFQEKAQNSPDVAYHVSGELKGYTDIPAFDSYSDIPDKHLSVDKQKELLHGFYSCISYTDAQIGKLLDELDRLGIANNTIIVLWGDHGWHLGDHGLWNKHTNFENATRTTLIISDPSLKGDKKTSSLTEFVDVYPTVVDLLKLPIPADLDGISLAPILKDPKAKVKEYAVSQYPREKVMGYTIRTDRYRYTEWIDDYKSYNPYDVKKVMAKELYDYQKDPQEKVSQAANPEYASVVKDLSATLSQHLTQQYQVSQKHQGVGNYYQARK